MNVSLCCAELSPHNISQFRFCPFCPFCHSSTHCFRLHTTFSSSSSAKYFVVGPVGPHKNDEAPFLSVASAAPNLRFIYMQVTFSPLAFFLLVAAYYYYFVVRILLCLVLFWPKSFFPFVFFLFFNNFFLFAFNFVSS